MLHSYWLFYSFVMKFLPTSINAWYTQISICICFHISKKFNFLFLDRLKNPSIYYKLIQKTFSTDLRCKTGDFVLLIQTGSTVWRGKWCTVVVCGMEPSRKRRQPQQPLKTNHAVVESIQHCIKIKK